MLPFKFILNEQTGREPTQALYGYKHWYHPGCDDRTASDFRDSKARAAERKLSP